MDPELAAALLRVIALCQISIEQAAHEQAAAQAAQAALQADSGAVRQGAE